MAWEIPGFHIPVQVNQGAQIASYADRLMGAYDQGQASRRKQDVLNARKSIASQPLEMLPDGTPNYQSMAERLLGSGDLDGANTFMRLGQQAEDRAYRRSRDSIEDNRWQMTYAAGRQDAENQRADRRQYFEQGRIPEGYQPAPNGNGYVAIPGGPADPDHIAQATEAKERAKRGGPDADGEQKLRKEIAQRAQPFQVVRDAYGRLISSNADAAGDIAMIFSYMRMLDPGSVVREGEFATAQNAAGVPDQIRNMYNKARNGERLNPEQRQMFKAQAKSYYERAEQDYKALEGQFIGAAQAYGFDPSRVIPVYPPLPSDLPAAPNSAKDQARVTQGRPAVQPSHAPGGGSSAPDPLGIR